MKSLGNRTRLRRMSSLLLHLITSVLIEWSTAEPILGSSVEKVVVNEYPFVVSFFGYDREPMVEKRHFCGGTLISGKHVLTAGHCILPEKLMEEAAVLAGSHKLKPKSKLRIFKPIEWLKYEDWAKQNNEIRDDAYNDIAVVKLNVEHTEIDPVELLPLGTQVSRESSVTLVGWGRTNGQVLPTSLRRAKLKLTPKDECTKKAQRISNGYNWSRIKGDQIICFTASPCVHGMHGDSGSPYLDDRKRLVGVHSGRCPPIHKFDPLQFNVGMSVDLYRDFLDYAEKTLV